MPSNGSISDASLRDTVEYVLKKGREYGATSAEASVGLGRGFTTSVRMGEVETIEHQQDKGLTVTVYVGHQKGSANTTDFRSEAVEATVKAACEIAQRAGNDDCAGLADPAMLATKTLDLDLFHPWEISPEDAVDLALRAETTAREADQRITNSDGASVSVREATRVYGNSTGFIGGYRASRHSQSCVVIAEDDAGMQRDYWYSADRVPGQLDAPEHIGQKAADRAVRRLGAKQLGTVNAPVLYSAEIAGGLVGHLIGAISGGNLYRKASFMLDKLGEAVFPDGFEISEDPHRPRAMGSAPFDAEGVATKPRNIVDDGRLEGYVLSSYSARKLGMQTTGNAGGVRNVTVKSGPYDQSELIKSMGRGLVVTELIGMGVNLVTGDYSRGAAGFWVEDGEVKYPVHEITIAGNLSDMFKNVVAVGTDIDRRGNLCTGSILIEEMTIAGN
ncbi:MAG: metalloprotease PmbA [Pseudomonadota bacterium]